jgi:hypothetical protein
MTLPFASGSHHANTHTTRRRRTAFVIFVEGSFFSSRLFARLNLTYASIRHSVEEARPYCGQSWAFAGGARPILAALDGGRSGDGRMQVVRDAG